MCGPQCTLLTQTLEPNYEDGKFSELALGIGDYVYTYVFMYVCMYVMYVRTYECMYFIVMKSDVF